MKLPDEIRDQVAFLEQYSPNPSVDDMAAMWVRLANLTGYEGAIVDRYMEDVPRLLVWLAEARAMIDGT